MRFKIKHEPAIGLFYADVVGPQRIEPWQVAYAAQIAAGKSARWAATSANRAMKKVLEEEWQLTDAHQDLIANYPSGSCRTMGKWQRVSDTRHNASLIIRFSDPKQALRFKLSWHERETEDAVDIAA